MYHECSPEVEAEAGVIAEVEAEAGVIAEVMAGATVRAILEVTLGVYDQGPQVGPNPGGR